MSSVVFGLVTRSVTATERELKSQDIYFTSANSSGLVTRSVTATERQLKPQRQLLHVIGCIWARHAERDGYGARAQIAGHLLHVSEFIWARHAERDGYGAPAQTAETIASCHRLYLGSSRG